MRNINTREELQKFIDEQRNGNTELTPYQAEQIELAKRRIELAEEKERNRAAEQERKRQAAERKQRADRNAERQTKLREIAKPDELTVANKGKSWNGKLRATLRPWWD